MRSDFIAVMDSGIGGLSVLKLLKEKFPNEKFLYYGDNDNAPYGNKSKRELLAITIRNVDYIKSFGVKAIVLACNTLSVNLIQDVIDYSGLPVFGIFPPVESSLISGGKTLLLSTVRTAENYRGIKNVDAVGLPTLVDIIEQNVFDLDKVAFSNVLKDAIGEFVDKKGYYKTVILGCTHYEFIKNQISDHFCPQKIIGGQFFTVKKFCKFLENEKSLVNYRRNGVLFVGKNKELNENFWEKSGQK